jgi:hypothetical protein
MSNASVAFVLTGSNDWRQSEAEDWDLDCIELEGTEKVVGHKQIDGSICKIVRTADGKFVGLTKQK